MTTVAAIDLLQGRISVMQQRLEHYLGDGPAGSGLRHRRTVPSGHRPGVAPCPWGPPTIDEAAATDTLHAVLTAAASRVPRSGR